MFVVVLFKSNYNLLLERDSIHTLRANPSIMYQMMFIWDTKGKIGYVLVNDSTYYMQQWKIEFKVYNLNVKSL